MVIRSHSDALLLIHVVFSTIERRPLLLPAMDAWLATELRTIGHRHGAEIIASGNADDHVHLVINLDPSVPLALLVQRVKGASSHAWNKRAPLSRLQWQSGFWAQSIDRASLGNVMRYVAGQREKHTTGTIDPAREQSAATVRIEGQPL